MAVKKIGGTCFSLYMKLRHLFIFAQQLGHSTFLYWVWVVPLLCVLRSYIFGCINKSVFNALIGILLSYFCIYFSYVTYRILFWVTCCLKYSKLVRRDRTPWRKVTFFPRKVNKQNSSVVILDQVGSGLFPGSGIFCFESFFRQKWKKLIKNTNNLNFTSVLLELYLKLQWNVPLN